MSYDLSRQQKKDSYKVETYFFLPSNLDISKYTYTKKQFYRDLLLYIRFKTPEFSLHALADSENRESPINNLSAKIEKVQQEKHSGDDIQSLDYEIRLVGCVLKSSLRDHRRLIKNVLKRIKQIKNSNEEIPGPAGENLLVSEAIPLINDFISKTRKAVFRFRSFREKLHSLKTKDFSKSLYSTYAFTDEYISLLIEWRSMQILQLLETMPQYAQLKPVVSDLATLIKENIQYRTTMNYPSVVAENSDNELFLFRFSVLKKFVANVLYLSVRTVEEGKGIEQFALAFAAGVAMIFATAIAFYYQKTYGTLSLSFFTALIVSYMFKDRIKALFQSYLQKVLSHTMFDKSTNVYDSRAGNKIGICRESVQFIKENKMDANVLQLRNRDHITEIENKWQNEKVIYYVRQITFFTKKLRKTQSRKDALTDIMRFNIRNFLLKMDEPDTKLLYLKDGHIKKVTATQVYHVNMVIKFSSSNRVRYERIRLVLTQNGIKRIEHVYEE